MAGHATAVFGVEHALTEYQSIWPTFHYHDPSVSGGPAPPVGAVVVESIRVSVEEDASLQHFLDQLCLKWKAEGATRAEEERLTILLQHIEQSLPVGKEDAETSRMGRVRTASSRF